MHRLQILPKKQSTEAEKQGFPNCSRSLPSPWECLLLRQRQGCPAPLRRLPLPVRSTSVALSGSVASHLQTPFQLEEFRNWGHSSSRESHEHEFPGPGLACLALPQTDTHPFRNLGGKCHVKALLHSKGTYRKLPGWPRGPPQRGTQKGDPNGGHPRKLQDWTKTLTYIVCMCLI